MSELSTGTTTRTAPLDDRWTGLARVVRPTLIVAVGGTGSAAAKVARQRIHEILGSEGPRNHFIAFRAFDTAYQDNRRPRFVDNAEYVYLGGFNAQAVIADIVEGTAYPHWEEWLPPRLNFQQVAFGAGGIRPIGRLCYFYRREQVEAAVQEALTTITDTDKALRFHHDTGIRVNLEAGIDIHLICSVCGGTGSGMFLDLSFDLRRWAEGHTDREVTLTGHLVLPEAFRTKPVVLKALEANAYVALEELDRFMNATSADPWKVEHVEGRPESSWRAPFDHCYLLSGLQSGGTSDVDTLTSVIGEAVTLLTLSQVGQKVSEGVVNMAGQRKSTRDGRGRLCCYSSYGVLGLEIPWGLLGESLGPDLARKVRDRLAGTGEVQDEQIQEDVDRFRLAFSLDLDRLERLVPQPSLQEASVTLMRDQYGDRSELPRSHLVDEINRSGREIDEMVQRASGQQVWDPRALRSHLKRRLETWLLDRGGGLTAYLRFLQRSAEAVRALSEQTRGAATAAREWADQHRSEGADLEAGNLAGTGWEQISKGVDAWRKRKTQQARARIFQAQAARLDPLSDEIEALIRPWREIRQSFESLRLEMPRDAASYYRARQALTPICRLDYFRELVDGHQERLVGGVLRELIKEADLWADLTPNQLAERFSGLCTRAVREHFAGEAGIDCDQLLADCYDYPGPRYQGEVGVFLNRAGANWELHESYALRSNRLEISAIGSEVDSRIYQTLYESNHHISPVEEQRPEYVPILRTEHGLSLIGVKRLGAYRNSLLDSIVHEQRYDLHFFLDRRWITRMEFVGDDREERRLLQLFSLAEMEGLIRRVRTVGYVLDGDETVLGDHRREAFLSLRRRHDVRNAVDSKVESRKRDKAEDWEARVLAHIDGLRQRIDAALLPAASSNGAIQPRFLSLDVFQIHSEIRALLAELKVEEKGI